MPASIEFLGDCHLPAVYRAVEASKNALRALESVGTTVVNLDVMRSVLARMAASNGLDCRIDPVGTAESQKKPATTNHWWVFFIDTNGAYHTVARITEQGITGKDLPKVCPTCGNPIVKGSLTHAHNVVSDHVWQQALQTAFANTIDKWFAGEDAQALYIFRGGLNKYIKTEQPSTLGAATQGDRRTCKGCELLQGSLTLLQRHDAVAQVQNTQGLGVRLNPQALGRDFGGNELSPSMLDRVFLLEITKQRIEDVVRGIANELYSDTYWDRKSGKAFLREKFRFLAVFHDTTVYYKFLDEIRTTALQKATGEPAVEGAKLGFQKQAVLI